MEQAEQLLDRMKSAVVLLSSDQLELSYANRTATSWLTAMPEIFDEARGVESPTLESIQGVSFQRFFPHVNGARLISKLRRGRVASFIAETTVQGRVIPIQWSLSEFDQETLMLEGHNYSSAREIELMLASYSEIAERKTKQLARERRRAERLLLNILPQKSINQLKAFGHTLPERFTEVSVLFLDFVGFTELSQRLSTEELFSELNDIFTQFDIISKRYRCERIKTIGDAYLAVCGMPEMVDRHAQMITCAAYQMRRYIEERNQRSSHQWRCRIGIHTGEVTGGVVGKLKYIYDIFGDGVNTASRMESYSEPMEINLSSATRSLLSDHYALRARGRISVKGKGDMEMFFLDHIRGEPCADNLCVEEIISPQDTDTLTIDVPVYDD